MLKNILVEPNQSYDFFLWIKEISLPPASKEASADTIVQQNKRNNKSHGLMDYNLRRSLSSYYLNTSPSIKAVHYQLMDKWDCSNQLTNNRIPSYENQLKQLGVSTKYCSDGTNKTKFQ
jgi:hypothetical protein